MQFTGLHDRNGKEIYEGDVVVHRYDPVGDPEMRYEAKEVEEIAYSNDCFGFKRGDDVIRLGDCMFFKNRKATDLEVIGNIYENPVALAPKFPPRLCCLSMSIYRRMYSNILASYYHEGSQKLSKLLVRCFSLICRSFWARDRHYKKLSCYKIRKSRERRFQRIRRKQNNATTQPMHISNFIHYSLSAPRVFFRSARRAISHSGFRDWPAPGSEDTELGVLMEPEVGHGETEVYARVQA